ncbi:T9SS type A sorting domain-containing protein [Pedobacter nanyangensis]|uniref:T9SS type A sorting domain-containing protein n=1 Tax=Pedobacter nanyangensis TaxID=1562389 RepID=UPI000DE37D34|nr:T9SS type A sorting domain-containing protein [Pedobacter nanyangensis]
MKKTLPFFACLCMLFALVTKAQQLTYKVPGPATTTSTDVVSGTNTQNNIKLDYETTGVVADGTSGFFYYTLNNTTRNVALTSLSANNITKISVQYRGTGNSSVSGISVSYGSSASAIEGTLTHTMSAGAPAPGILAEFTIPNGGAKFVQIKRTSSTARLYFVAAGFADYTLPTDYLPLELLSFAAKPDALGKTVNLNWKTTNEVNTQDFVVERKADGTDFSAMATVQSKNTTGVHDYSFTDKNPFVGNAYYRLKQRDKDGTHTYSDVVHVKIEGISLSLQPNPASHELVVNHENVKSTGVLKVVGLDGRSLIKANANTGTASTTINVASLASGTYLLVYEINGQTQSQKFIKK